jgi:hypothetical protein
VSADGGGADLDRSFGGGLEVPNSLLQAPARMLNNTFAHRSTRKDGAAIHTKSASGSGYEVLGGVSAN